MIINQNLNISIDYKEKFFIFNNNDVDYNTYKEI